MISDNASTDGTLEIARSFKDSRIRLEPSDRNLGLVAQPQPAGRALPRDVRQVPPRRRRADADVPRGDGRAWHARTTASGSSSRPGRSSTTTRTAKEWARTVPHRHEHLGPLERINEGRPLFVTIVQAGIWENWIGEPTSVLVTRDAFRSCGLFNPYLRQIMDLEFWLRVMLGYRVGFIEAPLALYRMHTESATASDQSVNRGWLDRLWMLEGLLDDNRLGPFRALISRYRRRRPAPRPALTDPAGRPETVRVLALHLPPLPLPARRGTQRRAPSPPGRGTGAGRIALPRARDDTEGRDRPGLLEQRRPAHGLPRVDRRASPTRMPGRSWWTTAPPTSRCPWPPPSCRASR